MIYRSSYFRKESRQAYIDNAVGIRRKMSLALFMGLVSFAVFFVLQTLTESVVSEAAPEIMQPSFFSTIYIYIHIALVGVAVYYIVFCEWLFFSEIRRNAWYVLIQLRYRPAVMIAGKLTALLYSVFVIYSAGFALTALLTVFLKYTFVSAYLPSLYLAGLTDVFLLTALSAAASLAAKKTPDARLLIASAAVLVMLMKALTGAYDVLRNRVAMQDLGNLIDPARSWYFVLAAAVFAAALLGSALYAGRLARLYSRPVFEERGLPEGTSVVRMDARTGKRLESSSGAMSAKGRKIANAAVTALLAAFVLAALAFNVLIILISTATPGNEVTIRGTIPYIFQSDTMQPDIMVNDLAFFRKVDAQAPLEEGQIVLFRDNNIVYVERITQRLTDAVAVDIDHYPAGAQPGGMVKQVPREAVYGVYNGRSRWLGALILFANTIFGRILFLLVPAVLLFFRGRIGALIHKSRGG